MCVNILKHVQMWLTCAGINEVPMNVITCRHTRYAFYGFFQSPSHLQTHQGPARIQLQVSWPARPDCLLAGSPAGQAPPLDAVRDPPRQAVLPLQHLPARSAWQNHKSLLPTHAAEELLARERTRLRTVW